MTPAVFINKWRGVTLKERSFYVSHFNDLCELVGHPTPVASDKTGASFTFERGAAKRKGGNGWADVWKKDFFAFEYKGKDRDLEAAFAQLEQYREDLENPPLLVAADASRLIIKTNFNKTVTKRHIIDLDDLASRSSATSSTTRRSSSRSKRPTTRRKPSPSSSAPSPTTSGRAATPTR